MKKAERFYEKKALITATLARCRLDFHDIFERDWTDALARRYTLAPRVKDDDDEAGKLLGRLQELVRDVRAFHGSPAVKRAAMNGEAPFRTKALFDWAQRHPKLLARFPRWDEASLQDGFASPRQWLARRVRSGGPQFFDRLKPRHELTPRDFAVISLLAGNNPRIDDAELKSVGLTVAAMIDLETKYMRKVLSAF